MDRLVTKEEVRLIEAKYIQQIDELVHENDRLKNALVEAQQHEAGPFINVPIESYCVGCQDISLKTQVVQDEDFYGNEEVTLIHKCKRADFCKRIAEQIKKPRSDPGQNY